MRWIGKNAEACRAEGIPVPRRLVQAMLLSGALAGLAMTATVLGYKGYYELGLGAGAGFTGIAVALLGRGHPLGIVLAAVLFGTLEQAGLAINAHVPKEAMSVLEACVHRARWRPANQASHPRRRSEAAPGAPRCERVSGVFSLTMLAETLRIAVPYACAAIGGIWSERSGVINIGLEGVLLTSAFASVAVARRPGSAALGLVAASPRARWSRSATRSGRARARRRGRQRHRPQPARVRRHAPRPARPLRVGASNSPSIEGFRLGPTGRGGAALLARFFLDPVVILALASAALTPWVLSAERASAFACAPRARTRCAAASVGVDVPRVRILALAVSGAICGLGGVHLAFDQHRFESGMSNGRGFMALAAVVVSGWRAGRALVACLAFGALEALQIVLQDQAHRSAGAGLIELLPYVATLVVLAFAAGRAAAPRGLGKHADG